MSTSFKCKVADIYEIDDVDNNNDDNYDDNDDDNDDDDGDEMRCGAHCAKANWVRSQLLETLMRSNCGENINCLVKDNDASSMMIVIILFCLYLPQSLTLF